MKINEENEKWAILKLSRFQDWPDFPQEDEGVNSRARSFLRLVHNRQVRDIMHDAMLKNTGVISSVDWDAKGMDPTENDADWILDLIEETMERFPLPITMREIYSSQLPPASRFGSEMSTVVRPADIIVKEFKCRAKFSTSISPKKTSKRSPTNTPTRSSGIALGTWLNPIEGVREGMRIRIILPCHSHRPAR
jgi:hypothetical protein